MEERTPNHRYHVPEKGHQNWHHELNANFTAIDATVPIKDIEANLDQYEPRPGATFIATDTGTVYDAEQTGWTKATRAFETSAQEGQVPAWRVYTDGSDWIAVGPEGRDTYRDAAPGRTLQYAADNAGTIYLRDTIPPDDPIRTPVVLDGTSLIGPGGRGEASVYIDTDAADPGLKMLGGGRLVNLWLRGDPDTVSGAFGTGTLLWVQDMGRGSVVEDVTLFGTTGHGMVVAGCQQMTFRHITVSRCGSVPRDTWGIYLTNSPTDGLETNANNWFGLQSHGGSPQGGLIAMRADQHPQTDHPRTQHFYGLNIENGPQQPGVPLIEIAGRDTLFSGGRIAGLDAVETVFEVVAGNRARNTRLEDLVCHARTGNNTTFYYSNGVGAASPSISDCEIRTDGHGIHLDFYNQTRSGLNVSDVEFRDTPVPIKVKGPKNSTPAVQLSNIRGSGEIAVQGAQLQVSNVAGVTWKQDFSHGFSPHITSDDGSFTPLYGQLASTNADGVASVDFEGVCQFPTGGTVNVTLKQDELGAAPYLFESELVDTGGDGTPDRAECTVYKRDGSPVGSGDVTVALSVHPHQ